MDREEKALANKRKRNMDLYSIHNSRFIVLLCNKIYIFNTGKGINCQ